MNVAKYAKKPSVSKALFEYILYHENSVREAMDLAAQVRGYTRQQNIYELLTETTDKQ